MNLRLCDQISPTAQSPLKFCVSLPGVTISRSSTRSSPASPYAYPSPIPAVLFSLVEAAVWAAGNCCCSAAEAVCKCDRANARKQGVHL